MKRHRALSITFLILFLVATCLAFAGGGCSADQVERAAQDVHYVAGGAAPAGEPSTQPSAGHQTIRAAVQAASVFSPAVGEIAGVVALLSGAVAGIAGHFNGKRSGRKQAHTVIAEIVDDVAAFKDPAGQWTDKTRKLLEDLGYAEAARPDSPASAS